MSLQEGLNRLVAQLQRHHKRDDKTHFMSTADAELLFIEPIQER